VGLVSEFLVNSILSITGVLTLAKHGFSSPSVSLIIMLLSIKMGRENPFPGVRLRLSRLAHWHVNFQLSIPNFLAST
jgi:hypothetical protein